ncbi:MAG: response regulator transcription factor, partial [Chloroflexota bacterium]
DLFQNLTASVDTGDSWHTVVAEAETGDEAIRFAEQHHPDVAVLDIRMPGISGVDACRQILEKVPTCKVVMLTSYAEEDLLSAAIDAGASGYVLKRIGNDELVNAVLKVGQGDGVLDPALTSAVFQKVRMANAAEAASHFEGLTQQEISVLALLADGLTNRQIAAQLFLGEGTVRNYVSSILSKIGVSNRAEAAVFALKHEIDRIVSNNEEN